MQSLSSIFLWRDNLLMGRILRVIGFNVSSLMHWSRRSREKIKAYILLHKKEVRGKEVFLTLLLKKRTLSI
jgi:hypothetical protein